MWHRSAATWTKDVDKLDTVATLLDECPIPMLVGQEGAAAAQAFGTLMIGSWIPARGGYERFGGPAYPLCLEHSG